MADVERPAAAPREAQHTPGPWEAEPLGDPQWVVKVADSVMHAVCVTSQGNDEANARLIAAAPDLLDAAQGLLALITSPEVQGALMVAWIHGVKGDAEKNARAEATIINARAAIAKARARTNEVRTP